MKKLITIILVLALLLPAFSYADLHVKELSDNELKSIITECSGELRNRATVSTGWILLFEYEKFSIYQIDDARISSNHIITVPVALINDNDFGVKVYMFDEKCNGWEIDAYCSDVSKNAKKKGEIHFFVDDAFVESLDQVESLQFRWVIQNSSEDEYIYKQEEPEDHRFW